MNYSKIPTHMVQGIQDYVEYGVPTGGFLQAVLTNNLVEAFSQADDINTNCMRNWAGFLYTQMPARSWGTEEIYKNWIAHSGLSGEKNVQRP